LNYKLIIIFIFVYNFAFSQPAESNEKLNTEILMYRDLKQIESYNIYVIKNNNFGSTLCFEIKQITVNDTIYLFGKTYNEFNIVIQNYQHLNDSERKPDDNNIVINKQITPSQQDLAYDNWATVEIYNSGIEWELFQKGYQNNKTLIDAGESALQFTIVLLEMQLGGTNEFYTISKQIQVTEGIYEFTAKSGLIYVGQSGDISTRIAQHLAQGKLLPETVVKATEIIGGKTTREIAEQLHINSLGGIQNLENIRNPIGLARKHLIIKYE